jgi:methionyl-tRNA formyltransferase
MNIVVFGTGPFAVPAFSGLLDSKHVVRAVVTRPISDPGQRRKSAANPVRDLAQRAGLPVLDPATANDPKFVQTLKSYSADLFFVCDFGQILSNAALAAARLGGINLHASLLPKYRGAAPINWAIYHGERETGVTVIFMTPKLDAGPSLTVAELEIGPHDTAVDVEAKLSVLGVDAVLSAIEMLEDWNGVDPIGTVQDPCLATKAPRLKKTDGQIDWTRTAEQIVCQIRAFQPWPGTYTQIQSPGKPPLRLIIQRASVMNIETDAPPAVVVASDNKLLAVQTGQSALLIEQIQPAGKRAMPIEDFLRGHRIQIGQVLG